VYHPQVELFHRSKTTMQMAGVKNWSGLVESKNSKKVIGTPLAALCLLLSLWHRVFSALLSRRAENCELASLVDMVLAVFFLPLFLSQ
jgi:hypothetical protein